MRQLVTATQSAQHIAGLQAGRCTGRTTGHCQPLDAHDQGLAFHIVEAHVQVVRHSSVQVAVDEHLLDVFETRQHAVMQCLNPHVLARHLFFGNTVSLAHAHNLVCWQGAGTHTPLMTTPVHLRLDTHPRLAPDKQRANAFRAIRLVGGQAHQVNRQLAQVKINPPGGLCRVNVENNAFLAADHTDRGNVLNHTDFIVDIHDAGQNGVGPDGRLEDFQIEQSIRLHIQISHLKTLALQLPASVQHSFVLGLDGDDVFAFAFIKASRTF